MVVDKIPLPFKIFSGEGGTDLDIKTGLMTGGVETAEDEVEQEGTAGVVVDPESGRCPGGGHGNRLHILAWKIP